MRRASAVASKAGYRFAFLVGGIAPYAARAGAELPHARRTAKPIVTGGGFGLDLTTRRTANRYKRASSVCASTTPQCSVPDSLLTLRGRFAWAHDWITDPSLAAGVSDIAGSELHRKRRDACGKFRACLRRRRVAPRQRRLTSRQIRRRVRQPLADLSPGTGTLRYRLVILAEKRALAVPDVFECRRTNVHVETTVCCDRYTAVIPCLQYLLSICSCLNSPGTLRYCAICTAAYHTLSTDLSPYCSQTSTNAMPSSPRVTSSLFITKLTTRIVP